MFANSTCFDDDLMKKMAAAVAALKEGAIVITTTDPVPSPALEVLEEVSAKGRGGLTGWVASSFFLPPFPLFDYSYVLPPIHIHSPAHTSVFFLFRVLSTVV